jgi:photoactive yellow protein
MLDDLDDSALDDLPFGVVCLSESMTVLRMNKTESEKSGIQRWRAIGRDFFGEVAPGPTNRGLAEQVRAFATGRGTRAISHTFRRRSGEDPTTIELVRGRSAGRVYLCIRRDVYRQGE